MSLRAILWAFDQEVFPASNKFVLVAMGNFCGDTALSHPNIASVCKLTSLHEDTVIKALGSLVEQGKLMDTGMTTGTTGRIKVYRFPDDCREIPRQNGVLKHRGKPAKSSANTRAIPEQSPNLSLDHNIGTGTPTGTPTGTKSGARFKAPTLEEVRLRCAKVGLADLEGEKFFNYYESNGWRVGKNPMKSWTAALSTWKLKSVEYGGRPARQPELVESRPPKNW